MPTRIPTILAVFILGLSCPAKGEDSGHQRLDVPKNTEAILYFLSADELKNQERHFELHLEDDCLARIFCGGSLHPPFAVALCKASDGTFYVIGQNVKWDSRQPSPKEEIKQSTAILEPTLAGRFLALLKVELLKVRPKTADKQMFFDSATFSYWLNVDAGTQLCGKTTAALADDSRLGHINRLSGQLLSFAFSTKWERTEILGTIDRTITEIELSNRFQH